MEGLIVFSTVCSTLIGMCLCFIGFQVVRLASLKRTHSFEQTRSGYYFETSEPQQGAHAHRAPHYSPYPEAAKHYIYSDENDSVTVEVSD